jgi:hypothetical protein
MLAHQWGIKTFYYSLINKQGAKAREDDVVEPLTAVMTQFEEVDDCEACKL